MREKFVESLVPPPFDVAFPFVCRRSSSLIDLKGKSVIAFLYNIYFPLSVVLFIAPPPPIPSRTFPIFPLSPLPTPPLQMSPEIPFGPASIFPHHELCLPLSLLVSVLGIRSSCLPHQMLFFLSRLTRFYQHKTSSALLVISL